MKINRTQAKSKAKIIKMFASPTRLRILSVMDRNVAKSVEDVAADVDMTHSAVSHQLAVMLKVDLVRRHQEGRHGMYQLSPMAESVMGDFVSRV